MTDRVTQLGEGVIAGKRRALAKAITLIESSRPDQREQANALISHLLPRTGKAIRVGVSGVPGVGKSTFIEGLGLRLADAGHRVAVLAVDPSSKISGGSILGDKVRMERLARHEHAFIRPSPSAGSLGGVARRTRETMLLCEAAGYDVLLIETVGVGQSEITVSEMVDFFLVLMLPGGGDEIQGIKRGIMEMADGLIIHKADGDLLPAAKVAQRHYQNALHYLRPKTQGWTPPVQLASSTTGEGVDEIWDMIRKHRTFLNEDNRLQRLRDHQTQAWFHSALRDTLLDRLYSSEAVQNQLTDLQTAMQARQTSPHQAAEKLVTTFLASEKADTVG